MARHPNNEFKPEYEKLVMEVFGRGGSMADFCVTIHNHRETVYNWMRLYPSFKKAYYIAREMAKAYRDGFATENMWQTYGEEGTNFDVKSYLRMTQPRFKDMERETPPPDILEDGEDPDLYKAIRKLIALTTSEAITIDQSKAINGMLNSALGIKEKEALAKTLADIEKVIASGQISNSGPVVSPDAECVLIEDEEKKPKAAPKKKSKTTRKKKDDNKTK